MRIITGLDIETTGLDPTTERIIEIALVLYDLDTREKKGAFVQRIHPQKNIHAAAEAVHGISLAMLAGCQPFEHFADQIVRLLRATKCLVAHNGLDFDIPFLAHELIRVKRECPNLEIIDTKFARWATPDGKHPKLGELAFALGVPYDESKAHGALYDVDVMMQCLFKGLDKGFFELPAALKLASAA